MLTDQVKKETRLVIKWAGDLPIYTMSTVSTSWSRLVERFECECDLHFCNMVLNLPGASLRSHRSCFLTPYVNTQQSDSHPQARSWWQTLTHYSFIHYFPVSLYLTWISSIIKPHKPLFSLEAQFEALGCIYPNPCICGPYVHKIKHQEFCLSCGKDFECIAFHINPLEPEQWWYKRF